MRVTATGEATSLHDRKVRAGQRMWIGLAGHAVDDDLRAADGIWAIGDVIGRGLAHVASAEGVYVAERIELPTPRG